ncbi:glycosyltransferase [Sphaerothrix gracilis]|uniref:glycosyltransferase n=1 Tax=Sphaerothrix gracilis TaxID=3151835 RepID=UPI0031FD0AB1
MVAQLRPESSYLKLLKKALETNQIEVRFLNYYRRKQIFPLLFQILFDKKSYDIIHLHWIHPYTSNNYSILAFLYSIQFSLDIFLVRLFGCKIVWTVHNLFSHENFFPKIDLWVRKALTKFANKIILLNQVTAKSITKTYGFTEEKYTVIPIGNYKTSHSTLVEKSEARNQLGITHKDKVFLNLGLLRPYKGIENLIRAWQSHHQKFPADYLVIAGKPINSEYSQQLEELVAETSNILLLPKFIREKDIPTFFGAADVAILPFTEILNSASLVLAMSYEKPIIAPAFPSIEEILEEANELLYSPNNLDELESAMSKVHNSDLKKLSSKVEQACQKLSWENIAKQTIQVYLSAQT